MEFTNKQIDMIKQFKWEENENEGIESQPGIALAEDVMECAQAVLDCVFKKINISFFEQNLFAIPIPLETHRLLQERYNPNWTDESRTKIFELIKGMFTLFFADQKTTLEKRLNDSILPCQATQQNIQAICSSLEEPSLHLLTRVGKANRYTVKSAKLFDEPIVIADNIAEYDRIIVEIEVEI
ncbi:MAG: hypothetical protein WC364_14905 [Eubacteriales bacterium]|jgi:hypothetical protein